MKQESLFNINYPIAKNHQIIQILPQFKPIKRGARKKGVERKYISRDGKSSAIIRMFKELDIADQDLLLTILAIALPISRGDVINKNSQNYSHLWKNLNIKPKEMIENLATIMITTTPYELLKELNKSKGQANYNWLFESLVRLANTTIEFKTPEFRGSTNLISYYFDENTEKLNIAINPVNAIVLMNDKKGYIFNNRIERLQLKNDTAKALHSVLLTLIDNNQTKSFNYEILIEKVYLENFETMNINERKNSKRTIKKALEKINELANWEIRMDKKFVSIKRKNN